MTRRVSLKEARADRTYDLGESIRDADDLAHAADQAIRGLHHYEPFHGNCERALAAWRAARAAASDGEETAP